MYIQTGKEDLTEAIGRFNEDLKRVSNWCKGVGLKINPSKSQAILIGYHKLLNSIDRPNVPQISLDCTPIPHRESVKSLGVTMDENLTWTPHIHSLIQKTYSALHSLKIFKNIFSIKLKMFLIKALVIPIFDYCDIVYSDIGRVLDIKLQRAQNACARYIYNSRKSDYVTPLFSELSWLKLSERRQYHSVCLLFQILANKTPKYLANHFHFLYTHHDRDTRSRTDNQLLIPHHRTTAYTKSFTVSASRTWNTLPETVRGAHSLTSFERMCYSHFLNGTE